jgi:hypothetical protein
MEQQNNKSQVLEWIKAIAMLIMAVAIGYKIYSVPITLNIDFPSLLSLLLALFSVGLSALFYFKATDTSNAFYDNTYKFTKDIAQLLVKIESGFGERLRHLDEGYSSMRNYLQNIPSKNDDDVEQTKIKLENEKQEVEKVAAERNEIIQDLVEKSQLQEEEKKRVLSELKEKEQELLQFQHEVNRLNKRLLLDRMTKRNDREKNIDVGSGLADFTYKQVVRKMGISNFEDVSSILLRRKFASLAESLPREYISDMESLGYFDGRLTTAGVRFIKDVAAKYTL